MRTTVVVGSVVIGLLVSACAMHEVRPGHYVVGFENSPARQAPRPSPPSQAPAPNQVPPAVPAASPAPDPAPREAPGPAAPMALAPGPAAATAAAPAPSAPPTINAPPNGKKKKKQLAAQPQPDEPAASAETISAEDAHLPKVFGLAMGGEIRLPNCKFRHAGACYESMGDNVTWFDALYGMAASSAGVWRPALLGEPVKLVGVALPDWASPSEPMVGQLSSNHLVAVQVRAQATDANFRSDLVEKFGRPIHETETSFRNTYGKTWTAPELEFNSNGLHVRFVPDGRQTDESAWGVLLIETDVAHKARMDHEANARAQRTKI